MSHRRDDRDTLQINTVSVDIHPDVTIRAFRPPAVKYYDTDDDIAIPSRYVLQLAHTLRLDMGDAETVRRLRDALDELLQMPTPAEVDHVLTRPIPTEETPTDE